jgi:hypothetical protein
VRSEDPSEHSFERRLEVALFFGRYQRRESTKIKSRAAALHYSKRRETAKSLVAAATAAAAASAARGAGARFGRAACDCGAEDGELDFGFLARALGARDVLLAVDDDLFERVLAVVADVFVDGHALVPLLIKTDYSKTLEKGRLKARMDHVKCLKYRRGTRSLGCATRPGKGWHEEKAPGRFGREERKERKSGEVDAAVGV